MVETIISRKLGHQEKAEDSPYQLAAVETGMKPLIKEYSYKTFNTGGMFILQVRNDKNVGIPITQLCQYQEETQSCPLSDCPCGHYKGDNATPSEADSQ